MPWSLECPFTRHISFTYQYIYWYSGFRSVLALPLLGAVEGCPWPKLHSPRYPISPQNKLSDKVAGLGGPEGMARALGSSLEGGIDSASVESRRQAYGWNKFKEMPPTPFLEILLEALKDPTLIMLMIAALVSPPLYPTGSCPSHLSIAACSAPPSLCRSRRSWALPLHPSGRRARGRRVWPSGSPSSSCQVRPLSTSWLPEQSARRCFLCSAAPPTEPAALWGGWRSSRWGGMAAADPPVACLVTQAWDPLTTGPRTSSSASSTRSATPSRSR